MIEQFTYSGSRNDDFFQPGNTRPLTSQTAGHYSRSEDQPDRSRNGNADKQKIYDRIRKTAKMDSPVLITGESGVGKTTIARTVHEQSGRRRGPFVLVNCAALSRSLLEAELVGYPHADNGQHHTNHPSCFERAHGGTLFLDQIGDLPLDLQPKLLTVIQDQVVRKMAPGASSKVDVHLITATMKDLERLCQQGEFRQDLYYRLNVLQIKVPPLRQRKDELPNFVQNLMRKIAIKQHSNVAVLNDDAIRKLQSHSWPGNIRELENVLERAAVFCSDQTVTAEDIVIDSAAEPKTETSAQTESDSVFQGKTLAEIERLAIISALGYCNGNKAMTARSLGISEKSIYNKMKRLGIRYQN